MNSILRNWNFMRILRLVLGLLVLIQGISSRDWLFITMGGLFALMPLLNAGCCGGSCNVNNRNCNTER